MCADVTGPTPEDHLQPQTSWPISFSKLRSPSPWFANIATTIISLIAIFLFFLAIVAVVRLAFDLLGNDTQRASEAVKSFLPIAATAVGLPLIVWRLVILNQQTRISEAKTQIDRETHYTSIFSRSVEQLGQTREIKETRRGEELATPETITRTVPNIEVRLGALYSLERLMRESSKDQPAIIETICAYVRENSPIVLPNGTETANAGLSKLPPTGRADVQAALTVIGRRPESIRKLAKKENWRLDLRKANLTMYDFSKLNFERVDFSNTFLDEANFSEADFSESLFRNAQIRNASFARACFQSCFFSECGISGAQADSTDFQRAEFVETDLTTASLKSIRLEGAQLERAFSDITLKVQLDLVKENGSSSYSAHELLKVYRLFQNATYDDKTNISATTRDVLVFIAQSSGAGRPPPSVQA